MSPNQPATEYSKESLIEFITTNGIDRLSAHSANHRKSKYFEIPCSFDIESTSAFIHNGAVILDRQADDDIKVATMWIWTFTMFQRTWIGRTWEEFTELCNTLVNVFCTDDKNHLVIFVHNLAFEFGFFQHYFNWSKVFAIDSHKPVQCITEEGIEFRCSYILSGYGLAKLGEQLLTYKCQKMVGDLDYHKLRHTTSTYTETEKGYIVNDTRVVCCYIQELIEQEGGIGALPLTQTGFVRNQARENCYYTKGMNHSEGQKQKKFYQYRDLMNKLTIEPQEYEVLRRAFQGGFTHANPYHARQVMENVTSWDFSSAYPSVMICEEYPMSKGEHITRITGEEFYKYMKTYCCVFDIKFTNLQPKFEHDNYISISHCWNVINHKVNNGRVVSADTLTTTITNVDFSIIQRCYTWDTMAVNNMWIYRKGYLPKAFVETILDLYGAKTTLKGVAGKEVEYMHGKGRLNSLYGMTVMDIIQELQIYEGGWKPAEQPVLTEAIEKYNKSYKRFTTYAWGLFVTAYCRRNLWTAIIEMKNDYVYADTDSVKHINTENHKEYLNWYNENIKTKMEKAMNYHGFDINAWKPKTIKGVEKPLGYWDDTDGFYQRFKSLGAKRYMIEEDNEINITVSGLNKKTTVPWLLNTFSEPFEAFNDGLFVPAIYTGKNTHTYCDETDINTIMIDYNGEKGLLSERSFVHLEASEYDMSIANDYIAYIDEIKEREIL